MTPEEGFLDLEPTRRDAPPNRTTRQQELCFALPNIEIWAARNPEGYTTGFALAILYAQEVVKLRTKQATLEANVEELKKWANKEAGEASW